MIVVASAFNQNKSQRWIDFLAMSEVQVDFVAPDDFESIKTQKYITIIGGVDEEAIRKLVSEIVGADEAKALSQKGAKKMYLKEGYGSKDQKLLIFTGSDAVSYLENGAEQKRIGRRAGDVAIANNQG